MTASATLLAVAGGTAQAAEPCVSGAEVRAQVQELVASLRDDVRSSDVRSSMRSALVESMQTQRGEQAETPAERRALGQEIAALARRQKDAETRVEGQALALQIRALTEQRERGPFTEDSSEATAAEAGLARAAMAKTDGGTERRAGAEAISALQEQFTCTPA